MRAAQTKQNPLKKNQASSATTHVPDRKSHPFFSAAGILQLQKAYGNRYVTKLIQEASARSSTASVAQEQQAPLQMTAAPIQMGKNNKQKELEAEIERMKKRRNGIQKELRQKYSKEYDRKSAKAKKKLSVPIETTTNYKANEEQREQIQEKGEEHGCHSCGTFIEEDKDQPWIGDHIPPTKLDESLKGDRETRLHPQCSACAHQQAALVKEVNKTGTLPKKGSYEYKLLFGGNTSKKKSIPSSGPKVSDDEGQQIQELGTQYGCHSCGAEVPASEYIADHFPPVHMYTPSSMKIQQELGFHEVNTENLMLLPQCPKCSSNQGGSISGISKLEKEYKELNKKLMDWE